MFSKRPCPHTGVVNLFSDAEPFLSIGSVVKVGSPAGYRWRCYIGEESRSGLADDLDTAERRLVRHYRSVTEFGEPDTEGVVHSGLRHAH